MDFFAQQDLARTRSWRLVLLLLLATAALIITTSAILAVLLGVLFADDPATSGGMSWLEISAEMLNGTMLGIVSVPVIAGVLLGALYKYITLRQGGPAVAKALGAQRIAPDTTDPHERRLLNVVEEMALASGIPVPPVYLMQDDTINAFAAGHNPRDAVIGVTRGSLHQLTRDELQGVVAHEFSHIFHGDMRLNLRLVALLHGIVLLGLAGYHLLRAGSLSSSSREQNQGTLFTVLAGLALMAMGFAGTVAGKIIKAAVNRQREFLADAAAVQYTRNPQGLAGALRKIAASAHGSGLDSPRAAEFGHFFFSNAIQARRLSLLATHPPLHERIARLDPHTGSQPVAAEPVTATRPDATSPSRPVPHLATLAAATLAIDAIGQPGQDHIAAAQALLGDLDPGLRSAARDALGAQALVCALMLDDTPGIRQQQQAALARQAPAVLLEALATLEPAILATDAEHRLPLLELALPTLRGLTPPEVDALLALLRTLVSTDQHVTLLEWGFYNVIARVLRKRRQAPGHTHLQTHATDCAWLLSAFARLDARPDDPDISARFAVGAQRLGLAVREQATGLGSAHLLDEVVSRLSSLTPHDKAVLLRALVSACLQHDTIPPTSAVLLRAISLSLDCPLPPLTGASTPAAE